MREETKVKKVAELASRLKLEVEKVSKKQAVNWAIECAQRVVHHFERSYPNDPRPRNALEIAKRWLKGETTFKEVRRSSLDAHAAAREAKDPVAVYAARSCAHAVATAHVITHAAGAALYALKAIEQIDPMSIEKELSWQLERLREIGKGESYEF